MRTVACTVVAVAAVLLGAECGQRPSSGSDTEVADLATFLIHGDD